MGVMALFQLRKMVSLSISFEKISVLDYSSNIGQVQFSVKSTNYYMSYGPFPTSKNGFPFDIF